MKNLFMVSAFFLSCTSFSQSPDESQRVRYKVGAFYSPDYTYRILNYKSPYGERLKEYTNIIEMGAMGYTTGLSGTWYFKKTMGVETGIYHAKRVDAMRGNIPLSSDMSSKNRKLRTCHFLGIPVKFNYGLSRKKMTYYANAGLGAEVILSIWDELPYYYWNAPRKEVPREYYKKMNLSAMVGLGVCYAMTKHVALSLEPSYTQLITSIIKSSDTKRYPFALGAKVGVNYLLY